MTKPSLTEVESGILKLSGDLTFKTIKKISRALQGYFGSHSHIRIDLNTLGQSNSAALALLLEWQEQAVQNQVSLDFISPPDHLRTLSRLYDVEALLFTH